MSVMDRIQQIASAIQGNRYISAISNGLMSLMPVTIVGSIGSLLNALPIDSYQLFLESSGLKAITAIPNEITNNLLALYTVFIVAQKLVESYGLDGVMPGLLSLMAFLIITPYNVNDGGAMIGFSSNWLGAKGLFTAFIVAIFVAKIYVMFQKNGWTIKMPDGVPPTVVKSFSALVPSFVIMISMMLVRFGFGATSFGDIHSMIFTLISTPLQSLGSNFFAILIAVLVAQILWSFGMHGTIIVISVLNPILTPLTVENLAAFNAGGVPPHVVTMQLFGQAINMGSGQTLGLAIAMLFAKSKQYKTLGRLSVVPNACGINEPIIFGTPIVMNFKLMVPFIIVPMITVTLAYIGMITNILPPLPGTKGPLGTPVLLKGFIAGGGNLKWVLFELISIVISFVIYLPFFRKIDKEAYDLEVKAENEESEELESSFSGAENVFS